jgi:alpha-D-xyloside xylohydrolase
VHHFIAKQAPVARRAAGLAAAALLLGACQCAQPNTFTLASAEARIDVTVEPFSFVVRSPDGGALLSALPGDDATAYGSFAATLDHPTSTDQLLPGWDGYRSGEGAWLRGGAVRVVSKTASAAQIASSAPGAEFLVTLSVDGPRVRVEAAADGKLNKSTLAFALPPDEHFFGLGERFATFDHRGWSLYSWAEEGALGGGEAAPASTTNPYPNGPSMTYFPVPFFLSSKGYGLHLDTTFRSELHFGSERPEAWRLAVNAPRFAFTVYVNDKPTRSLDQFTADTGRPVIPAPWVFGPWRRIGSGDLVDGKPEWQVMRERKLPLTVADDAVHFLPDRGQTGRETELRAWVNTLHHNGIKAFAYNNSFVASDRPNAAADFEFGKSHGYFVKDAKGDPALVFLISGSPMTVAMIDFTNPDAAAWFKTLLQRTIDLGYDGWMHDFGEYVPRTGRLFDGRLGDQVHNLYPVLSAQAAREVLQAAKPDDGIFFVRSGYTGQQAQAPVVWGGDAEADFDETQGLPSAVRSALGLAFVGVPYWGSDGTGYKCITDAPRDKEVFIRWLEVEGVSPIMREENACANPMSPRSKWHLWDDEETQSVYRAMASLHTRLQPYFVAASHEAARSGLPLMRPPFLFMPEEPRTWTLDDSFFLGPALYAAPVVRRGKTTREVWFPPGARYVDLFDLGLFEGGATVTVPAPLAKLPLYLVEGQLLPLLDAEVQTLAPATDPLVVTAESRAGVLDVRVALGPNAHATLTLADGTQLTADTGGPGGDFAGFTEVAEAALQTCERCYFKQTLAGLDRLRFAATSATLTDATVDGVHVKASSEKPLRVRWDVLRLP